MNTSRDHDVGGPDASPPGSNDWSLPYSDIQGQNTTNSLSRAGSNTVPERLGRAMSSDGPQDPVWPWPDTNPSLAGHA